MIIKEIFQDMHMHQSINQSCIILMERFEILYDMIPWDNVRASRNIIPKKVVPLC